MAKTKGHGNPKWTRDETILALALYLETPNKLPGPSDPRVIELSNLLRRHPLHSEAARKPSFRNPDGVSFKLQNIRSVATGKGLSNTSVMDKAIWAELGMRPREALDLAYEIKSAILRNGPVDHQILDEEYFHEGRLITKVHQARERDPKLRQRVLIERRRHGSLRCDCCSCISPTDEADYDEAIFEIHHLKPVSRSGERITKLSDVVLLCANCHRLAHRGIAKNKKWLSLSGIRSLLKKHSDT